ncbi:hypothetical protein H0O00_04330 [Candidatus Micrarchaeota archaeon]|nr:hypothetical protein [Candidatus Micrarchaeota archaeon]
MEKNDIIKILALLVVVGFITELFFFGGGYKQISPTDTSSRNVTGTAVFNGTIRTYDPLLVLPLNTSQAVIDQLRLHDGVKNVRTDQDGIVVETETRDDVYPIAAFLRTQNVSSLSIANIAVTEDIVVDTATGDINATPAYGVIRVVTEPMLDMDSDVSVSIIAVVSEGFIIDYRSASIMTQQVDIPMEAAVASLNGKIYMYSIPWESRDSLGNLSAYGTVSYRRIDSIIFQSPLTVGQIMTKKQFPYITYIDASSAQVEPSFTNVTELALNFQDVQYSLPPSALVIATNQTPDIQFNSTVSYSYTLDISNSSAGYDFGATPFVLETGNEYAVGDSLSLNVSATVIGGRVISYRIV